jgi:hypothetical protein
MLEDAGAFLKADKFQDALDASRRVTQFDPNNFQAFMCVGMANFQLQNVRAVFHLLRTSRDAGALLILNLCVYVCVFMAL